MGQEVNHNKEFKNGKVVVGRLVVTMEYIRIWIKEETPGTFMVCVNVLDPDDIEMI